MRSLRLFICPDLNALRRCSPEGMHVCFFNGRDAYVLCVPDVYCRICMFIFHFLGSGILLVVMYKFRCVDVFARNSACSWKGEVRREGEEDAGLHLQ